MANELVINVTQHGFRIALLRDKGLIEYHVDEKDNSFTVGDVYLGTLKKILPSLNASFIDIGYKKDAFLHYSDLGPQFRSLNKFVQLVTKGKHDEHGLAQYHIEPTVDKVGKIADVLSNNQHILVQVVKEPISNKGPRLSADISIAGRYMILVPFTNTVNLSKKITSSAERNRLLRLITSIKPQNFGVIVRTAAEGREAAKLDRDLKDLLGKWAEGVNKLRNAAPRDKIIGEINRASSILRDMLNESFDNIVVDDRETFDGIKQYTRKIAPEKEKIVRHYQEKAKIFEHFGIEKQLKMLFGQTVNMESGGYLIIEHTEAMHVVDVNSGNKTSAAEDQEEMALNVNMAAAKEVARQIRLRDMGGIIVVDFIDMKDAEHKRELYQKMKEYLKEDRSKTTVLPLSKFGLMQITRQRVRPEMNIVTQEQCPACAGTGKIDASIAIAEQIERKLQLVLEMQNEARITLFVHPYLYAYFTAGFPSRRIKWLVQYKKWVKLLEDSSIGVTEFKFFDQHGEEIELT
ncbi:MAG: Rne/Rng family ribonuclease [Amoebophilaceae bacterium]|nr:Rne/Rng family ribonuclease [Amoebophilaceae bacterium]